MSSIVYLKNKQTGKVYAYLNESVWDSEKKKCVCKRKCLGHVDPVSGDIVPNRGHKDKELVKIKSVGTMNFLDRVAEKLGLTEMLKQSFPDDWKLILSCVYYVLSENDYFSRTKYWSTENDNPYGKMFDSHHVSEVLSKINENTLFVFFREWRDTFTEPDYYSISISSQSSFDKRMETIRFNDLPIIIAPSMTNITFIFSSKYNLPVTYLINSKNPSDMTSIRRQETSLRWLQFEKILHVLDRDFYNDDNLKELFKTHDKFIIRAPPESEFARESITRVKGRIMDLNNYKEIQGLPLFVMSFLQYWDGRKCYTHIYFSAEEAETEFSLLLGLLEDCQRELQNNIFVPEHEKFYKKYFTVKETSKGRVVEQNGDAIMRYNDVAGFIVLVSNSIKNPTTALEFYIKKDKIQRNFENLRNEIDRTALKLYSDVNYAGRIFIQFLALIMYMEIKDIKEKNPALKNLGFRDLVHEMKSVRKISIPVFNTPFYTNFNNTQSEIIKSFGVKINQPKQKN